MPRSRLRALVLALSRLGVAVGVAGLAARTVPVDRQPVVLTATFSPHLAGGSLLGAGLLASRRPRWGAALGAAVVGCTVGVNAALFLESRPRFDGFPGGPVLTVLQANLLLGRADATSLVREVRGNGVDVLAVQELTAAARASLGRAGLDDDLPYSFTVPGDAGEGTGLWSRYPITGEVRHDGFRLAVLSGRISVDGAAPITVFSVHLTPPWPYPTRIWAADITRLRGLLRHAAAGGAAVLVAGDFNSTRDHPQFRRLLRDGFTGAAEQTGAGLLLTYPADRVFPPLIAIDHVLTRGARVTSVRRVALPGSDHRGLLAQVVLPRG